MKWQTQQIEGDDRGWNINYYKKLLLIFLIIMKPNEISDCKYEI